MKQRPGIGLGKVLKFQMHVYTHFYHWIGNQAFIALRAVVSIIYNFFFIINRLIS